MIIDAHTHAAFHSVYPDLVLNSIKKELYKASAVDDSITVNKSLIDRMISNSLDDKDCSKLICQMEKAKISKSILLIIDFYSNNDRDEFYTIEEIYRYYHDIYQKHKEKFVVFAGIDPRRGKKGIDLFEKGIKSYGFKGLKLYPPIGFDLDDRSLYPFYEICSANNIPVLAHIGTSFETMKDTFNYPDSILNTAKEFRNINFILGHAALLDYENSLKISVKQKNVFFEISGFQKIMRDKTIVKKRFDTLMKKCPEKIIFGSDWPMFNLSGSQKDWVDYFMKLTNLPSKSWDDFFCNTIKHLVSF